MIIFHRSFFALVSVSIIIDSLGRNESLPSPLSVEILISSQRIRKRLHLMFKIIDFLIVKIIISSINVQIV